eukprot:scaffold41301_cov229-Amphora_coffeaeformis.AAC.2
MLNRPLHPTRPNTRRRRRTRSWNSIKTWTARPSGPSWETSWEGPVSRPFGSMGHSWVDATTGDRRE